MFPVYWDVKKFNDKDENMKLLLLIRPLSIGSASFPIALNLRLTGIL